MNVISVIIPVYACSECLPLLYQRIKSTIQSLGADYEILFVNDRSPDNSWQVVKEMASKDKRVKGLSFSRNYGQHYAITAGFDYASGDFIVVMDCDLQDPPEEIEKLYRKAIEGYEIVYGYSTFRGKRGIFRLAFRKAYFYLYDFLVGTGYKTVTMSFFILSSKALAAVKNYRDRSRHIASIIRDVGFNFTGVEVEHDERDGSKSSYTFLKRVQLAINGIIIYSSFLLRVSLTIGFVFSFFAIVFGFILIYNRLFRAAYFPGWTSLIVLLLFSTGLILSFLGIFGIYLEKLFYEVRKRPLYIIDEFINHEQIN